VLELPEGPALVAGVPEEAFFSWELFEIARPPIEPSAAAAQPTAEQDAALARLRKGLANLAVKGWGTPREAIIRAYKEVELCREDKVLDIGCGDGRALIEAARLCGCQGIGYEIEEEIADEARALVEAAGYSDRIEIVAQNAMEVIDSVLYAGVTVVFLYLQAQGLKKVLKYLRNNPVPLRVVTFSYQFARLTPEEEASKRKVFVDGKWDDHGGSGGGGGAAGAVGGDVTMPMFFYTIGGQSATPFRPEA